MIQMKHWNLHQLGCGYYFHVWVPSKWKKKKKNTNHISACNSLLKYNKNVLFLKQTVDGQWKVDTVQ